MKKTLVMTLILALILSIATIVSAAESTATVDVANTVEEDGTINVTVDLGSAVRGGVIRVKYNAEVLELQGMPSEVSAANPRELGAAGNKGVLFVGDANTEISTVTFTFKAIGEVNATTDVEVSGQDFITGADSEEVAVTFPEKTEVTIVAKAVVDPDPGNTGDSENPGTQNPEQKPGETENKGDNTNNNNKPAEENTGKKPTNYPQTGVNVAYVAGAVVLAVVAGYVVTKRS